MNIGINGYEAVVSRFGFDKKTNLPVRVGSGEYAYELLLELSKVDKKNNYYVYLPIKPTRDMPSENKQWRYIVFPSKKLWTLLGLSNKLLKNKEKINVFFSPTHYLPPIAPKSVISILDVSYLKFPDLFKKKDLYQLKIWGRLSIKKAKKILTISESSKSDIIKYYGVKPDKIRVIYPGVKEILNIKYKILNMEELKKKFGIEKEYILFVGTIQPRKNIIRLIEAFVKLDKNLQLVIVGKKGWQYEEILEVPKKLGVSDKVLFIDSASDEDLPSFYKSAKMFVLPSLYEGFGLPILEAMQNGCPVITSNISSLPEAGGDAALYVDPENVEDIKEKMEKLLSDEGLRKEMIEKGYQQVKKFSWEKSAKETLKVLEEVGRAS